MEIVARYVKRIRKREREREKNPGKFGKLANLGRKCLARTRVERGNEEFWPHPLNLIRFHSTKKKKRKKRNSRFLLLNESSLSSIYIYGSETERGMQLDRRLAISRSVITVDEGNGVWVLEKFYRFV